MVRMVVVRVDLGGFHLVRDDTEIEEGLRDKGARQVVKQDARVVGMVPVDRKV